MADRATITVDPDPSLTGATLAIALATAGPLAIGSTEIVTATLMNASNTPIANFPVSLAIAGVNPGGAVAVTNASGVAAFSYVRGRAGIDLIHATALGTTTQVSSSVTSLTWTEPATGGPLLTQGWIAAPGHQTTVLGQVPVVLSSNVTLASGTITYWPVAAPTQVGTVGTGLAGAPGATIATFDTTLLANGSYILRLEGTDSDGNTKSSQVMVTVAGDYKPGRLVTEVTDLTIPVAGMPITLGRRYDSLEKDSVGDFGHGWSLLIGHPKLEVDPAYGITLTLPEGRRASFRFAPTYPVGGPVVFGFLLFPKYEPAPGVFGKLTSNGCSLLSFNPFASNPTPICLENLFDPENLPYAPTEYTYTDPYGREFLMAATGELKSIKDRSGNTLTFTATGITSSAGPAVTFQRDGAGRITKVTSPPIGESHTPIEWTYGYDTAVTWKPSPCPAPTSLPSTITSTTSTA